MAALQAHIPSLSSLLVQHQGRPEPCDHTESLMHNLTQTWAIPGKMNSPLSSFLYQTSIWISLGGGVFFFFFLATGGSNPLLVLLCLGRWPWEASQKAVVLHSS